MPGKFDANGNPIGSGTSVLQEPEKQGTAARKGGRFDPNGNPLYDDPSNPASMHNYDEVKVKLPPRPIDDQIFDYSAPAFSTVGSMVAGPPGGIAGGIFGKALEKIPEFMSGDWEKAKSAGKDVLTEGVFQGATEGLAYGIPAALRGGRDAILRRALNNSNQFGNLEDIAATLRSDVPNLSVGQVTGSPFTRGIERLLGPTKEKLIQQRAQEKWAEQAGADIKVHFGSPAGPGNTGHTLSDIGRGGREAILKEEMNAAQALGPTAKARHAATFTDRIMKPVLDWQNPSRVMEEATKDPDAAGAFIRALGPNEQKHIRSYAYEKLLQGAKDIKTDGVDPNKALELLDQPQFRRIFSAGEYSDLTDLYRTLRRVAPDTSNSGKYALYHYGAGIALGGATDILDSVTGFDKLPIGAGTLTGAALVLGPRSFAKNVLLNPRYARAASKLAKLAPDTSEAKFLRRSIMVAMRGSQVGIKLLSGEEVPATVGKNGNLILNQAPQETQ